MTKLGHKLRQLAFPAALRIRDPGMVFPCLSIDDLRALIQGPAERDPADPGRDRRSAAKLATAVWRLSRQADKLGDSGPAGSVKKRVAMLADALTTQGIETVDYTGRPLDENELWDDVIGAGEQRGRLVITGMREPRVLLNGAVIQRGQPIVESNGSENEKETT